MTLSILTTDLNLIIWSWDTNLEQITGIDQDDINGRSLLEIVPELQNNQDFVNCVKSVLKQGLNQVFAPNFYPYLIPCDPILSNAHFTKMQQKVIFAPLKEGETIKGIIVTIEDITEQLLQKKEIELQLEFSQNQKDIDQDSSVNLEELDTDNWLTRQQIVKKLIDKTEPEINAELIELLRQEHRNSNILNSVLKALEITKIDIVPSLIHCLQEPDEDLRIYSALLLGEKNDKRAIFPLIQALEDPNDNVRFHAIEALGRIKAKEAIEYLVKLAKSEDFFLAFSALDTLIKIGDQDIVSQLIPLLKNTLNWEVRKETVDILTLKNTPELTQELLHLLKEQHHNPNILNSILQILALSNVDSIPALIECLKDDDPNVRLYTALALGERGDLRGVNPLINALKDENVNVRYHAIDALGHLRSTEAVNSLIEIAKSEDFFLAFPAIDALLRIGDPSIAPQLIPLLNNELLALQVIETLGVLGDGVIIPDLVKALNHNSFVGEIALAIAKIYERYDAIDHEGGYILELISQNIEPLGKQNLLEALNQAEEKELKGIALIISTLKGEDIEQALVKILPISSLKEIVIDPLVNCGSPIIDLILPYLENQDLETCKTVVTILGRIGNPKVVEALTRLLHEDRELTFHITSALAQIGDHQAFDALISLLGYPDITVRLGAIAALNSLAHPEMPQKALSLLTDPDPLVRESGVKIAGYFAFEECLEALFTCANDENENVRQVTVKHLPYLDDEERVQKTLINLYQTDTPKVRAAAIHALGELDPTHTIPYLLEGLKDPHIWVRYEALKALSQCYTLLEPSHTQETLRQLELICQGDPAEPVRAIATETLGKLAQDQAIPLLKKLMKSEDEEVARAAIRTLGKIPSIQAIPPLLSALNFSNTNRRMDALQAFRERGGTEAEVTLQWMVSEDTDHQLVLGAIKSLCHMATPEAIQALLDLTMDPSNREACINALAHREKQENVYFYDYIDLIAKGLNHHHINVRCAVIEILKRLKHPRASEYLIKTLEDTDSTVRLAAVNALVYLGNRNCLDKLSQLAKTDPSTIIRRTAQKGLLN
jgi:HEAT repeat protein